MTKIKKIKKNNLSGSIKKRSVDITGNTTLERILEIPRSEKVLIKYNIPCLSCPMASMEIDKLKIGEVCKMYGFPLEKILKDLNNGKNNI